MVQRWRQLPLDHALSYSGRVRALVQSLADGVAQATGVPTSAVPDCGPATLMDQLTVMVYDVMVSDVTDHDASAADVSGAAATPGRASTLAQDLVSLRRELS